MDRCVIRYSKYALDAPPNKNTTSCRWYFYLVVCCGSNLREVGLTRRRRQTGVCRSALADSRRSGEASPTAPTKLLKSRFQVAFSFILGTFERIS